MIATMFFLICVVVGLVVALHSGDTRIVLATALVFALLAVAFFTAA